MAYFLLEDGSRLLAEDGAHLLLEEPFVAWAIAYWGAVEVLTTADAFSAVNAAEVPE